MNATRIDILTLFPRMFEGPFAESIVKRAIERGLLSVHIHNIRDFTADKHHMVDDCPYGGGAGMVMKPEPVFAAVESVVAAANSIPEAWPVGYKGLADLRPHILLMTPQGRLFNQQLARELAARPWLLVICGHYEGVDDRVREHLVDDEISIGDYVLTGGELPAMVFVDALTRCLPGALGSEDSAGEESHSEGLLEYPHYTRPPEFRGWRVPEVLLSGNHAAIAKWRRRESLRRTLLWRPDLLTTAKLSEQDTELLEELRTLGPES